MKYLITFIVLFVYSLTFAQHNTFTNVGDSDPEAIKLLDNLRSDYDSYRTLKVEFDLTINLPEQSEEVQNGILYQKDNMYFVDMNTQSIYNNGETLWLHLKKNKEVQINNVDDSESNMMSPKDMLASFDNEDYVYAIAGTEDINGETQTIITFKPLDSMSEYAKIDAYVSNKGEELRKMRILAKDGSIFTLKINSLKPNLEIEDSIFTFDKNKFPEAYIEDLRID